MFYCEACGAELMMRDELQQPCVLCKHVLQL